MTDSILIVGGGVAGLTAALDCAAAGANAIVVERDAIVGGRLAAAMTAKSSVGAEMHGVPMPKLAVLNGNQNIEIMTLADVHEIEGRPGNFNVSIRERQRFVTEDCTRCNHCRPVCPVVLPNEHDAGLSYRKAIYTPLVEALPQEFVIDIDACLNTPPNYLPCNRCAEVCDDNAIFFDRRAERSHRRQVGAVIVAAGFATAIDASASERGYGQLADVVTTAEMERLLTAPGPTGGFAAKPSNEEYPERVLFVIDELTPFTVATATSQVDRLLAQDVNELTILLTFQPGAGEAESLLKDLSGSVTINHGLVSKIVADDDQHLVVTWADFASRRVPEEHYDIVVLGTDIRPADGLDELAGVLGVELDETGYIARRDEDIACATSCAGIYVAGGAVGPTLLGDAVAQAGAAAAAALAHLDPRLLNEGQAVVETPAAAAESAAASAAELQARIERALFAMLEDDGQAS